MAGTTETVNIVKYFPKYDTPFKYLFKNKEYLIDLLNDILNRENNPIIDLYYIDTEIPAERAAYATVTNKLEDLDEENKKRIKNELEGKYENDIDKEKLGLCKEKEKIDEKTKDEKTEDEKTEDEKSEDEKRNEKIEKLVKNNFIEKTSRFDLLLNSRSSHKKRKPIILKFDDNEKKNYSFPFVAVTEIDELINVEIQVQNNDDILKQSLFYASKIIARSLPKGSEYKYDQIPNTIMINFLHYNIFKKEKEEKYHWCFNLRDEETNKDLGYKDILNIHFIDLKKFESLKEEEKTKENNLWLLFLIDPNNKIFKMEKNSLFFQARNDLISLERNEEYCKMCEDKERQYEEYIHGLEYREKKGKEEGREEGMRKNKIEILLSFLKDGWKMENFVKNIKLPEEDAIYISNFYNDQNRNVSKLACELSFDEEELKEICNSLNINYIENNNKRTKISKTK